MKRLGSWALLLLLVGGGAFASVGPLQESLTGVGAIWRALRLDLFHSNLSAVLTVQPNPHFHLGLLLYTHDLRPSGIVHTGTLDTVRPLSPTWGLHVQTDLLPNVEVDSWGPRSPYGEAGVEIEARDLTGVYYLLFWSGGGEGTPWSWELFADSASRGGTTEGRAFLYTSKDFSGLLSLNLYAEGVGARVQRSSTLSLSASHTLVGAAAPAPLGEDELTMESPSGVKRCPCFFPYLSGPSSLGAGTYTFRDEAIQAGIYAFGELLVGGADVTLPN